MLGNNFSNMNLYAPGTNALNLAMSIPQNMNNIQQGQINNQYLPQKNMAMNALMQQQANLEQANAQAQNITNQYLPQQLNANIGLTGGQTAQAQGAANQSNATAKGTYYTNQADIMQKTANANLLNRQAAIAGHNGPNFTTNGALSGSAGYGNYPNSDTSNGLALSEAYQQANNSGASNNVSSGLNNALSGATGIAAGGRPQQPGDQVPNSGDIVTMPPITGPGTPKYIGAPGTMGPSANDLNQSAVNSTTPIMVRPPGIVNAAMGGPLVGKSVGAATMPQVGTGLTMQQTNPYWERPPQSAIGSAVQHVPETQADGSVIQSVRPDAEATNKMMNTIMGGISQLPHQLQQLKQGNFGSTLGGMLNFAGANIQNSLASIIPGDNYDNSALTAHNIANGVASQIADNIRNIYTNSSSNTQYNAFKAAMASAPNESKEQFATRMDTLGYDTAQYANTQAYLMTYGLPLNDAAVQKFKDESFDPSLLSDLYKTNPAAFAQEQGTLSPGNIAKFKQYVTNRRASQQAPAAAPQAAPVQGGP
jgi:hypothetical protein